jgi:hypothetical protein
VSLAHRSEPEIRISEKWARFSALDEALTNKGASDGSQE